jgi:sterol desaturase/sphingolipid hydroxylase (fatty acid hydroxylase superfamily)
MPAWLEYEPRIRLIAFGTLFAILAVLEIVLPRRPLTVRKGWRWASNLALVALNSVALRLIAPLGAVGAALVAQEKQWGLLNIAPPPAWLAVALAVLALDLIIYAQHVAFHYVPLLWRMHRVHHADLDLDVSSGLRFHTLEILLSLAIKIAAIFALGAPPLAVLVFEIILNATSMFSHANWRLPLGVDAALRWVVVTPDMHRVHHSIVPAETNRNFGFNVPWWDWLFRTYQAQPRAGHEGMSIGLEEFRDERQSDRLPGMLLMPLATGSRDDSGAPSPDR